jgi:hypothetical protein
MSRWGGGGAWDKGRGLLTYNDIGHVRSGEGKHARDVEVSSIGMLQACSKRLLGNTMPRHLCLGKQSYRSRFL